MFPFILTVWITSDLHFPQLLHLCVRYDVLVIKAMVRTTPSTALQPKRVCLTKLFVLPNADWIK